MKHSIPTIALVFSLLSVFAGKGSENIHSDFANKQGVMALSFSKEMLDAVDLDFDWKEAIKKIEGDFKAIKLLIISDETQAIAYSKDIKARLKKQGYVNIELEDAEGEFEVYVDKKRKNFNEVHLLSRGDEGGILISIYGDFEVTDK
jgi:hypothetical protein